ncbi:hypothetical protein C8046_02690 [Serinibacter arcticus]|uniref:Preprotein translocase subunit YajC n=1 Tax=Serinibacter arcticus TaxID=1655435 RepID=A0A2U1ZS51_9MICO|nr:preprotein translocase subunit YajC [Serinibacter arcticus]PWD49770.1 hypothetical protein C8046_02690 [Serinibacter arcticus]
MFAEGGSSNVLLIGVLVLAVVGLFFMSRRNRKQQGSMTDFRSNLGPGSEVMTASGQLGVVVAKDGDAVTIESGGSRSTWVVAAIQAVPPQFSAAADAAFGRAPIVEVEAEEALEAGTTSDPEFGAYAADQITPPGGRDGAAQADDRPTTPDEGTTPDDPR